MGTRAAWPAKWLRREKNAYQRVRLKVAPRAPSHARPLTFRGPSQTNDDTELGDMGTKKDKKKEEKEGHFWRDHKEEFMSLLPFLW